MRKDRRKDRHANTCDVSQNRQNLLPGLHSVTWNIWLYILFYLIQDKKGLLQPKHIETSASKKNSHDIKTDLEL